MHSTRLASACALGAAAVLALMLLITLKTGVNQQHFELALPVAAYTRDLLAGAGPLRLILTCDAAFIALYATSALLLTQVLTTPQNALLLRLCAGAVIMAGGLDLLENHHITSMLRSAELGLPLSQAEISAQAVASMFKWHVGYVAFFALGCALDSHTLLDRVLRWSLLAVQLPMGAAVYTAPATLEPVFLWLRYGNLLAGFIAFAWLLRERGTPRPAFAATGSASPV